MLANKREVENCHAVGMFVECQECGTQISIYAEVPSMKADSVMFEVTHKSRRHHEVTLKDVNPPTKIYSLTVSFGKGGLGSAFAGLR